MIKYRVVIKASYHEVWFEFNTAEEACAFSTTALKSMVDSEDQKRKSTIRMEVIDTSIQDTDDEE